MIKSYTDIEQSNKLMEFLPIETADCYWSYDRLQGFHRIEWFVDGYNKHSQLKEKDIPCWSLVALLNVLPKPTKRIYELNIYGEDEKPFFGINDCDINLCKGFEGDDYIDACVNMIVYLHEKLNAL